MAGGDPEWAASLRADEMRDWSLYAPELRSRVDRGALAETRDKPEPHEAEADR